jgi:hypothetical protein
VFPHGHYAVPPNSGEGRVILRGKKNGYAAIAGRLSGNTQQENEPSSAYCLVLPDIAAYGTWGK